MFRRLVAFVLVSLVAIGVRAVEQGSLDAGLVNPGYREKPQWFKDSFLEIREDIDEATAADKRVVLYFYQDGCPYCDKLLQDNFGNQAISDKTRKHFDVISINMWGDREVVGLEDETITEKQFSQSLKVQYTPTLLFLDEEGKVIVRVNGYFQPHLFDTVLDYVSGRNESAMTVREYITANNPQAASGKLHFEEGFHKAPVDLSALSSGKPVLLMFEQKACAACDELHLDILQREAVRQSFDQFDVVLLDLWSKEKIKSFDGTETTVGQLAASLGVQYAPSLLFFVEGNEVFRTEAYLKAFHTHGALDYVLSGAYSEQPEFQRFLQDRRTDFEARGLSTNLWE